MSQLKRIISYQKRIRRYLIEERKTPRTVSECPIKKLYSYSFSDPRFINQYLNSLVANYGLFFERSLKSKVYTDCLVDDPVDESSHLIWENNEGSSFVKSLLKTDYCNNTNNNMATILQYFDKQDLKPGFAIAQYLTFDIDPSNGKKYRFYQIWIQIKD